MNKNVKIWTMVILILSIMILPGTVSATEHKIETHIEIYKCFHPTILFMTSYPCDELTVKMNREILVGAALYSTGITWSNHKIITTKERFPEKWINYEIINSNGTVIRKGTNMTILCTNLITWFNAAEIYIGSFDEGEYQLKFIYKGNNILAPSVKNVKLHVVK